MDLEVISKSYLYIYNTIRYISIGNSCSIGLKNISTKKGTKKMIYQKDYILREIESLIHVITDVFLGEETTQYLPTGKTEDAEVDNLYLQIQKLLETKKINEAENLLFDKITISHRGYLKIAVNFYQQINQLNDEELAKQNFSREEIEQGIKEVMNLFGIVII